jgi:hypothetical protein
MKAALAGVHAIPETNEAVYFGSVASACPIIVVGRINSGIAYLNRIFESAFEILSFNIFSSIKTIYCHFIH